MGCVSDLACLSSTVGVCNILCDCFVAKTHFVLRLVMNTLT